MNTTDDSKIFSFKKKYSIPQFWKPAVAAIILILAVILFIASLESNLFKQPYVEEENDELFQNDTKLECKEPLLHCRFSIVESIPENLTYPAGSISFSSTYSAWKELLLIAKERIEMAEFYFSLRNDDVTPIKMPSSWQGEDIYKGIIDAGKNRNVIIRIAQNKPSRMFPQNDTLLFEKLANAQVRALDFDKLLGGGILHTKLWIVDGKHVYLGSANMDWQSLTQVKEVGVVIHNCPCIAEDLQKIFEVYWYLGKESSQIPKEWPSALHTIYNMKNPMLIPLHEASGPSKLFISSSPPPFNPDGRESDIDAIVNHIKSAEKFIYIAVMDYYPRMLFSKKGLSYWPVIDNVLRESAFERQVTVRLMASHWNHSRPDLIRWLTSLQAISGTEFPTVTLETKLFVVPSYNDDQKKLMYARVNHNKYMVTDKTAYIGTSNWSGDYFTNTAGVSLSITQINSTDEAFRKQLEALFERDWFSEYAKPISHFDSTTAATSTSVDSTTAATSTSVDSTTAATSTSVDSTAANSTSENNTNYSSYMEISSKGNGSPFANYLNVFAILFIFFYNMM